MSAIKARRVQLSVAVTSLYGALAAASAVPASVGPEGAIARELLAQLFAAGTGFTKGDAVRVWDETGVRLERIELEALGERIRAVTCPSQLSAVVVAHEALGQAIAMSGSIPSATTSVRDATDARGAGAAR